MAKSGTLRQYFTQGADLFSIIKSYNPDIALFSTVFDWNIKSQDVATNTSVVEWAFKVEAYDLSKWQTHKMTFGTAQSLLIGVTNNSSHNDIYVSIDGTEYYSATDSNVSVASNSTVTLASGEITLTHDSDGILSSSFSAYIRVKDFYDENGEASINNGQLNYQCSASGSFALDNIPRHAVLTEAPNFTDEDNPTIKFVIPDGATNVKAYIALDGDTESIAARSVSGSSYTFNFTEAERAVLWGILNGGVDNKQVRFYLTSTYNGTSYKVYLTRVLTVINYTPTLDPEVWDTDTDIVERLTGNKYILVKYASKVAYTTGATGHKGATINSQSVKNGETTKYGASGTFDSVTDNLFKFAATDSFGRNVAAEMEFSRPNYFIDYVKLTCNSIEVTDLTADGDVGVTIKGKYFNNSFGKRNNSMRLHYDLSKNGGELEHFDKGYVYPAVSGSDYTYSFTIPDLDYQSVYTLTVRVSDEITVEGTEVQTILASTPIFDWGRTDFNFNVPVTIQGWQVDTVVEESTGETGYYEDANGIPQYGGFEWTFRKWSSGLMECWCSLPITTAVSNTWGSLYTSGRLIKTNLLFPREFIEPPVVTATLAAGYAGGILMTTGSSSKPVTKYSAGTLEIARGGTASTTQYNYTINYIVKGRWK